MIIGITGGSGAGKSTLLAVARELGITVLDCDVIYHELLTEDTGLLNAIEARFPGTVEGKTLLRKKLGSLVFSDAGALRDLNAITHAAITRRVRELLRCNPRPHAAIDAAALLESGMDALCDVTVAVTAPVEERVRRLIAREGIGEDYARKRIAAQPDEGFYRENCGYILENHGSAREFRGKCLAFFEQLGIMRENPLTEVTNDQ